MYRTSKQIDIYNRFFESNRKIAYDVDDWYSIGNDTLVLHTRFGDTYTYEDKKKKITRVLKPEDKVLGVMTEEDWRKEFLIVLRNKMKKKGIKGYMLADKTGLSRIAISKYVNATRTPSSYNLVLIADALGCLVSELTYFDR